MIDHTPDTLEDIMLDGDERLATRAWERSETEWVWALRFVQWGILTEGAFWDGFFFIGRLGAITWSYGRRGRRLCRAAVRALCRQGVLRSKRRGRVLCVTSCKASWRRVADPLWDWLATDLSNRRGGRRLP
jgi:hypothetical protein